ncbi:MAG: hypothetical protein ACFFEL_06595 [Candidatus Thorarchaeota archaeon]
MNRYDLLIILGLVVLIASPIVVVVYRFTEPPIPLAYPIGLWPVDNPLVISGSVTVWFSFVWLVLSAIQALNIANTTRGSYRLVFAWIILVFTIVIQNAIITQYVVPQIEFWSDASRHIEVNIIPQMVLNCSLVFYSISRQINHRDTHTSEIIDM